MSAKTSKPTVRRGFILDVGSHPKMLVGGWKLWIVEDGDSLEITENSEGDITSATFERVIAALEKVLAKRNDEYVPFDPDIVAEGVYEPGEWPEVPTLCRAENGLIVYTHECGEDRYFPRAAARALLSALREGSEDG